METTIFLKETLSPAQYWLAISGENNPDISSLDTLRDRMDEYGYDYLWDYPLCDLSEAIENNELLALVCSSAEEARIFELPRYFLEG